MKILISLISYENLTGSELYVYELSKQLTLNGHEVVITAPRVGGEITLKTRSNGVEVYSFEDFPSSWKPDVMHVNEYYPSAFALCLYPKVPAISTVHSQFSVEKPFVSDRIYKYICIRPEVQQKAISGKEIAKKDTVVIYNGVDFNRFQLKKSQSRRLKTVLFVGTIDPLRKKSIMDLINDAAKNNYKVIVVGKKHDTYLDSPPPHVEVHDSTWDIQRYIRRATETAGILLGRTTIEGWVAGLPGWIYEIDLKGEVIDKKLHQPPADIDKFNIVNVTDKIQKLYEEAISRGMTSNESTQSRVVADAVNLALANSLALNSALGNIAEHKQLINYLGSENSKVHQALARLEVEINRVDVEIDVTRQLRKEMKLYAAAKRRVKKLFK